MDYLAPKCDTKHSGESDPLSRAQTGLGADEVRRTAGAPWALKREELVREMVQPERPNIFDGTIRDRLQLWTADLWCDIYSFPRGGSGLSKRMEGHYEGRFMHQVDPKDGYSVDDC